MSSYPVYKQPPACVEFAQGKERGITTAVVVAAFGAICVAGVLVALWVALRRPRDARLEKLDRRRRRAARRNRRAHHRGRSAPCRATRTDLGPTISATLELGEVLQRTLAATHAIKEVDGGRIHVRRSPTGRSRRRPRASSWTPGDGTASRALPTRRPFAYGIASWEGFGTDALRSGLVVPLGRGLARRLLPPPERLRRGVRPAAHRDRAPGRAGGAERVPLPRGPAPRRDRLAHRPRERARLRGGAAARDQRGPAARRPLCLIQIDLDDFGAINKRTGSLDDRQCRADRVRRAGSPTDPRQRHRVPELGRRRRVLPDPARRRPAQEATLLYAASRSRWRAPPFGDRSTLP